MPGFWRKAQVYLGLGPDDEYEEYEDYDERAHSPARESREAREVREHRDVVTTSARVPAPSPRPAPAPTTASGRPAITRPPSPTRPSREQATRVRPSAEPPAADGGAEGPVVRPLPPKERPMESSSPSKSKSAVRPVAAHAKPVVVSPTTFNSAQELADKFKTSQPVILNLQGVDKDLSRRLLDFCSGICYALSGHMEKVAARVYLLTPANVEVSAEERRRLHERGMVH